MATSMSKKDKNLVEPRPRERISFTWANELQRAVDQRGLSKGERTRIRLKAGAALALQESSYKALRVADIAARASVSHGLFYHYFADKKEVVLEVADEFLAESTARYFSIRADGDTFQTVYLSNLFYLNLYEKNSGLMAAILSLTEEDEAFCDRYNTLLHKWHVRMSRAIGPLKNGGGDERVKLIYSYSLGGMIDQLCRQRFVQDSKHLKRIAPRNEDLAEVVSQIWYRSVFSGESDA